MKEVYRLARFGVRLEDSPKEGSVVHHNSKSSLVVYVKSKQHLDPLLMKLNKLVLSKFNKSFSQRRMGYSGTKVDCVYRMWMT